MSAAEIKTNTDQKMHKSLDALKTNLAKIRSGRANPGILEHIQVEYYGNPTPLSQVASLKVKRPRLRCVIYAGMQMNISSALRKIRKSLKMRSVVLPMRFRR